MRKITMQENDNNHIIDFNKLQSKYRQDLIKGREDEFKKIYKYKNLYKNKKQ